MSTDIIGDVHGQAWWLEALLAKLGYRLRRGVWRHATRKAVFVGDLIDRGPEQLRTLRIVRAMVDAGAAEACLGNHEFNAIAFSRRDPLAPDQFLRVRHGVAGAKNLRQHAAFLEEVGLDSEEHRAWIAWFMERPLWIETAAFRVVHACWSPKHVRALRRALRPGARLTPELVERASRPGTGAFASIDLLLKGDEVELPIGGSFKDKDGVQRHAIRTRWWDPHATTYRTAYMGPAGVEIPDAQIRRRRRLAPPDRPTFIGHYWLSPTEAPAPLTSKLACLDYSAGKGGPLVAYRYDGENILSDDKFVVA